MKNPTQEEVFNYWKQTELNSEEPNFWKDREEYNISEMVDMAMEHFDNFLFEETFELFAWEYSQKNL